MRLICLCCALAAAGLLTGCGSKAPEPRSATSTAAATASPEAALTSPSDVAACGQLEETIRAVSLVVGHTTEDITQALHPKELAAKLGTARHSLLDSAKVVEIVRAPKPLAGSQREFAQGLRMFAADFARGQRSAAMGDMQKATAQLTDEAALRKIQVAAKHIDDLCGA
jgi:hypothetical protein